MYRKKPVPTSPERKDYGGGPYGSLSACLATSGAQHLTAATTTGGQHSAAVLGGHTGTETVYLTTLNLLGLESTEHSRTTPCSLHDHMALRIRIRTRRIPQNNYYIIMVCKSTVKREIHSRSASIQLVRFFVIQNRSPAGRGAMFYSAPHGFAVPASSNAIVQKNVTEYSVCYQSPLLLCQGARSRNPR